MHLPTLIAQNVPCTKVQQMMGAVCHQQTPLSYTAETRKVIILAVLALDNIKACQSHSTMSKHVRITKTQQASSNTLAPTYKSTNRKKTPSLTHVSQTLGSTLARLCCRYICAPKHNVKTEQNVKPSASKPKQKTRLIGHVWADVDPNENLM